MKVYRCLCEKDEIELFKKGIISLATNFNDYSDITLNTHDYGINNNGFDKKLKRERIHFFLFKEDAAQYMNRYISSEGFIAEYEIPDYLVMPNIGIGIYTLNENKIVLETAIPFGDILRDVNYEQYLVYYDMYRYNLLNVKYLSQKLDLEKELNLNRVPSKIVKCDYPIKLLNSKNIKTKLNYDIFNIKKEYKSILKYLGIELNISKEGQLILKYSNKTDLKKIRKLLQNYRIIDKKDNQKKKIK